METTESAAAFNSSQQHAPSALLREVLVMPHAKSDGKIMAVQIRERRIKDLEKPLC